MPVDSIRVASDLQQATIGVRLYKGKFGTKRAFTLPQKLKVSELFGAADNRITASKKLFDTSNERFATIGRIQKRATKTWRQYSMPYPELGTRLIKRSKVEEFDQLMHQLRAELIEAVDAFKEVYPNLVSNAQADLGDLYDAAEYPDPDLLCAAFTIGWDFPELRPAEFLKAAHPDLYRREQQRVQAQFDEALRLAEEAMAIELKSLVDTLLDKLTPGEDGKPKQIRKAHVAHFEEFFAKIEDMSLASSEALTTVINQAKELIQPQAGDNLDLLRNDDVVRASMSDGMTQIKKVLDAVVASRPKRAFNFEEDE